MAKIPFSKLQLAEKNHSTTITIQNKNGEDVSFEVRYYIPFAEKAELVSRIINQAIDDNGFYNPLKLKFYTVLEVIYTYTNITFTDKQKEDPHKIYNIFISNGIFAKVVEAIRGRDWNEIQDTVQDTIQNIYNYRNSAMGIMEQISQDYSQLDMDATEIRDKIGDPDNLGLLRDVLAKLG